MKKKLIALAVSAGVIMPGLANAAQVAGDALEIYGKVHVSVDSVSAKDTGGASIDNMSISGNSSRLGFKGKTDIGSMTGFFKYEANIKTDESGGNIDHRAAYVGLKGSGGAVLIGYRDTPFKDVRGKFDIFGDTVGDARNIMGVLSDGTDEFNVRSKNVLMYSTPKSGGFQANVMYSTAYDGTAIQGQDNNDNSLTSLNAIYKANQFLIAAAYEEHKLGATNKEKGMRLVGTYNMGSIAVGLMYEKLDNDNVVAARRAAYGVNVAFKTGGDGKIKLQYVKAGDNDAVSDTGATSVAVGYDYKLAKNSSTYIMYSKVSNDTGATYGIGGGHDSDKYTTATGTDVSAISVGYKYSF